ncbi:nitrogenase iron-molybdenum cofactor biosynthesis protein NifN [Halorhodospira halochloris]|uniref:nitrogenase iron-molybdenum cofactor biosynthesis protein NifN n=1 Tax=Halorhodospira halochloris TaxID=1052 RepID=UPI001EE956E1|nr:nitrogenase iron-molybdenum cofactor biosynthesis protein NifN [Halorhodospira halochloris]MCG5530531.1 nitrogenase iron-molybdenum cofactor biosynthesis protein NifN [Halorhodospira halochloris]
MPSIEHRTKALTVNPLKASQPLGGSLATLGFCRAMPLLHGSQGCTAFGKVYFVRHFNEPIPLQSSAVDKTSAIMGADENIEQALHTICTKNSPSLITVLTTGLTETAGTDIERLVKDFRRNNPELAATTTIVPVNTADFTGSLESGYAATLTAILDATLPNTTFARTRPGKSSRRVNLLLSSSLTPGDVEELLDLISAFDLEPVAIPDLSASLDGHLEACEFDPLTTAGTAVESLDECGNAAATIVIGSSLYAAADLLTNRTGVPDIRFDHMMGMQQTDRLIMALREISGRAVPRKIQRRRQQFQDALLDTHLVLGQSRIGMAGEADLLAGLSNLVSSVGMEIVSLVAPDDDARGLEGIAASTVKIGDLEDLEVASRENGAEIIIGSGHAAATAERLGIPIVQHGYPIWERLGLHTRSRVGYRGSRDLLFDLANALLEHREHHPALKPYRSVYKHPEAEPS